MSQTTLEIESQPKVWKLATTLANSEEARAAMPTCGEKIAVIGCGTSWFMAKSYCALRESLGHGISDAFTATEFPTTREYDRVICLSRSGTTTEIIDILAHFADLETPTVLLTAVTPGPASQYANYELTMNFADEESVVQTRFASSALIFFKASLGLPTDQAIADAANALNEEIPARWIEAEEITFLGTGWTIGLADEAGLKLREASQSWTETYPAMEYRHGPISIAQPGRLTWVFGEAPVGLAQQVAATGAEFITREYDPLAMLVLAQRLAVSRALARGLNPDTPRHLTRSVILKDGQH